MNEYYRVRGGKGQGRRKLIVLIVIGVVSNCSFEDLLRDWTRINHIMCWRQPRLWGRWVLTVLSRKKSQVRGLVQGHARRECRGLQQSVLLLCLCGCWWVLFCCARDHLAFWVSGERCDLSRILRLKPATWPLLGLFLLNLLEYLAIRT